MLRNEREVSMLELNLFGIPELRYEGELLSLPSPKNLAILSYLALKGESVSRKDLSELFWKDGKPANVRFVLHKLREISGSGEWLETNEIFVCVKAVTDVKRFENAIHHERYGEALEFHPNGETLLKGLELPDASEFMNWLELERSRLSQLYLESLQGHIKELEKVNKTDEALKLARQLLEQDKLNENVHRAIMRLEHKRGNTEAALAQFETLRNILKEELDVEPLEDTLKLLREIEGGGASSTKNALLLTSATTIPAKPRQLFGRDKLLKDVETHLENKKRVLLHGFGGMGKTALATLVAARWLEQDKKSVLWLQAGNDDATLLFDAVARAFDAQQTLSQTKDAAKAIRDLLIKHKISLFVLDDVWNAYALSKIMEAIPESIPLLVTSRQRYPNLTRVDVGRLGREAALELLADYAQPLPPLIGFEVENFHPQNPQALPTREQQDFEGEKQALTSEQLPGFSTSKVSESKSGQANLQDRVLEVDSRLSDGGVPRSQEGHRAGENPPVSDLRGTKSTSSVGAPSPPVRGGKDDADANQLCELLGDHAFALRLAGLALREKNLTVKRLYEQIKNNPHDFKMPGELQEAGRESVGSLLSVSLEALEDRAYETFLSYGVLEAPIATPGFLANCLDREVSQIEDALFSLVQCGLAERVSKPGSDLVSYRIHDLSHSYAKANRLLRVKTLVRQSLDFLKAHKDEVELLDIDISNILAAARAAKEQDCEDTFIDFMYYLAAEGSYYIMRGHTKNSIELVKIAVTMAEAQGRIKEAHYLYSNLGDYYQNFIGDFDRSIDDYQKALTTAREIGDKGREAVLLGIIGQVAYLQNKLADSDMYIEQAYQVAKSSDNDYCLNIVLGQMSYVAMTKGNMEEARKLLRQSLELMDKLDRATTKIKRMVRERFFALLNLGQAERHLSNSAESLATLEQALSFAEQEGNQLWMAYAHYEIGEMNYGANNHSLGEKHMLEALQLFEQNGATKDVESVLSFLKNNGYAVAEEFL
jgi:DNA-binding SARP family transcriptional activator/predicted transcriptional regulator